jgi:hypothetical protein
VAGKPAGQRGEVEELSGAAGTQAEEGLKEQQIADLDELAHVALDIGRRIVRQPLMGRSGNAIRLSVVLPDCRGPVRVRIGYRVASSRRRGWSSRSIMTKR